MIQVIVLHSVHNLYIIDGTTIYIILSHDSVPCLYKQHLFQTQNAQWTEIIYHVYLASSITLTTVSRLRTTINTNANMYTTIREMYTLYILCVDSISKVRETNIFLDKGGRINVRKQ